MRLKSSLLYDPGHVLRVIRQKHAKNRWQRKSAITRACAPAGIDRVNEEKHILITTQLVHTTCNSKVSKQHEIVSLTLADNKIAGGCNPESVKRKKKLLLKKMSERQFDRTIFINSIWV